MVARMDSKARLSVFALPKTVMLLTMVAADYGGDDDGLVRVVMVLALQ